MADYTNSTLASWIDWKPNPHLPLCYKYGNSSYPLPEAVSCAQVCNNSTLLFDPQFQSTNLVNCGRWSALVISASQSEPSPNETITINIYDESTHDELVAYEAVGLNSSDYQFAPVFADTISSCFAYIYTEAVSWTFLDDDKINMECTRSKMFPGMYSNSNDSDVNLKVGRSALNTCLDTLCSPLTLNPELAGIGVFSSFLIQSGIAILIGLTLLTLESIPKKPSGLLLRLKNMTSWLRTEAFKTCLVSFHKAQCYFASTVQITAMILVSHTLKDIQKPPEWVNPDFLDTSVLILLAASGLVPVSITSVSIRRFGRDSQSWYILILSIATCLLATATLAFAFFFGQHYAEPWDFYGSLSTAIYEDSSTCSISGEMGDSLFPLCGSWMLNNNALSSSTFVSPLIWPVWANSIIWIFSCVSDKLIDDSRERTGWRAQWHDTRVCKILIKLNKKFHLTSRNMSSAFAVVRISGSFAIQVVLFSSFYRHEYIPGEWTFAQVIAVTVWIPSIIELIYYNFNGVEEGSKHNFPEEFKVIKMKEDFAKKRSLRHPFGIPEDHTEDRPLQDLTQRGEPSPHGPEDESISHQAMQPDEPEEQLLGPCSTHGQAHIYLNQRTHQAKPYNMNLYQIKQPVSNS